MTPEQIKQRVHAKTIQLLVEQSFAGIIVSLLIAFLLSGVLWSVADHGQITGWLLALLVIATIRIALNLKYKRSKPFSSFHRLTMLTLFLNGSVWGATIFLRLPPEAKAYETAIFFAIGGLVAGVVGKYSARVEAVICFSVPALLPLVVHCFLRQGPDHFIMATMTLVYMYAMISTAFQINNTTIRSIKLNENLNLQIFEHEQTSRALQKKEEEQEELISELQNALDEVKTLSGFLPICASCKKIRDDKGYWNQIETYIKKHSEAEFSHGICPECAEELYPSLNLYKDTS